MTPVYVHHDVSREDEWERVVGEAERRFGKLDVLINNAEILEFGTVTHETTLADYMRLIEVNQVGAFLGMRTAIPAMMRRRGGSIVNISSTNGFAGYGGTIAYTASKFAVRGMTKTAALEYGKANIRVNSIHPGGIDTPMTRGADLGGMTEEEQDAMYGQFTLGRAGKPEEVADLALFLASDESGYCTGAEIHRRRRDVGRSRQPLRTPDLRLKRLGLHAECGGTSASPPTSPVISKAGIPGKTNRRDARGFDRLCLPSERRAGSMRE